MRQASAAALGPTSAWRRGLLFCHILVIGSLTALCASFRASWTATATLTLLVALPLILGTRGLIAMRRGTLQRLSVLLVVYFGLTAAEVVASGGRVLASLTLALVCVELVALLLWLRRPDPSLPGESVE